MKINWFKIYGNYEFLHSGLLLLIINYDIEFNGKYSFLMFLKIGVCCNDCRKYYAECECENEPILNEPISKFVVNFIHHNLSYKFIKKIIESLTKITNKPGDIQQNKTKIKYINNIIKDLNENKLV